MHILLGITGCIAAYKTPDLVRLLSKAGHDVRCIVTDNGARLVAPHALATVSGNPVHTSLWQENGTIPHIDLMRWCDGLLIAPATAHSLAACALGLANDLLSTAFLALEPHKPMWFAPAMNTVMWNKAVVQEHIATLADGGAHIIEPISGELACGEEGVGAMAPLENIIAAIGS